MQVDTGGATITLEARATAPLAKVIARVPEAPWPKQEIWSYEAAPSLRVTTVTSALQVDPRQAYAPDAWQTLPAFALGDGATLAIDERSRGLAPDEKNRLTLDREMWLDFAGDGWFAQDRIGGAMLRGWRFEVAPPFALERADAPKATNLGQIGERLLVTRGSTSGATGVEWRTPAVDLSAGVRIASAASSLPVTGWQDSFDRVTTQLHLPSGYKLLGAPGADSAAGSWISRWTLLDVFLAAIVALLAWRLFGAIGGALAVAYLVLGYQESGAPLWTLLAALALGLVARALPAGKLATATTWLGRAALVRARARRAAVRCGAVALRAASAARERRHVVGRGRLRQRGDGSTRRDAKKQAIESDEMAAAQMDAAPPPASAPAEPKAKDNESLKTITVTGSNIRRVDILEHYNASTIVQTGAGEPRWNVGEHYFLSWSGPVLASQTVRLVIAPPWLVRILRVALVVLLAALVVRLVRGRPMFRAAVPVVAAIAADVARHERAGACAGVSAAGAARPVARTARRAAAVRAELRERRESRCHRARRRDPGCARSARGVARCVSGAGRQRCAGAAQRHGRRRRAGRARAQRRHTRSRARARRASRRARLRGGWRQGFAAVSATCRSASSSPSTAGNRAAASPTIDC